MKDFFKGIFSTGTPESAKRLFGAIGFICAIMFIAMWEHSLIDQLLYISASLLGLETLTNLFNKKS